LFHLSGDEEARLSTAMRVELLAITVPAQFTQIFSYHTCCEVLAGEHVKQKEALRIALTEMPHQTRKTIDSRTSGRNIVNLY
jgi:hypothetical protein